MINEGFKKEILNTISKINSITNINDRVAKAIELKVNIYKNINEDVDDLFANLKLKK